jgi:hypothetical protein
MTYLHENHIKPKARYRFHVDAMSSYRHILRKVEKQNYIFFSKFYYRTKLQCPTPVGLTSVAPTSSHGHYIGTIDDRNYKVKNGIACSTMMFTPSYMKIHQLAQKLFGGGGETQI